MRGRKFFNQSNLQQEAIETFLLKMKTSGKELDAKRFDAREKALFDASDAAEWKSWIDNKVVQYIPPERARKCSSFQDLLDSTEMGESQQRQRAGQGQ